MDSASEAEQMIGDGRRVTLTGRRGSSMRDDPVFALEYGPALTGWTWANWDDDLVSSPSGKLYRYSHHESGTGGDGVRFDRGALSPVLAAAEIAPGDQLSIRRGAQVLADGQWREVNCPAVTAAGDGEETGELVTVRGTRNAGWPDASEWVFQVRPADLQRDRHGRRRSPVGVRSAAADAGGAPNRGAQP